MLSDLVGVNPRTRSAARSPRPANCSPRAPPQIEASTLRFGTVHALRTWPQFVASNDDRQRSRLPDLLADPTLTGMPRTELTALHRTRRAHPGRTQRAAPPPAPRPGTPARRPRRRLPTEDHQPRTRARHRALPAQAMQPRHASPNCSKSADAPSATHSRRYCRCWNRTAGSRNQAVNVSLPPRPCWNRWRRRRHTGELNLYSFSASGTAATQRRGASRRSPRPGRGARRR